MSVRFSAHGALLLLVLVPLLGHAEDKLKIPDADDYLKACRQYTKYTRELQDPANASDPTRNLRALQKWIMDRAQPHLKAAVIRQCVAIMQPVVSVRVDRSYLSDSRKYGHAIVTYKNNNEKTLTLALVRCDAIHVIDKEGTQEVAVPGPIPPEVERTLEFMIPLAGEDMSHVECTVTLER